MKILITGGTTFVSRYTAEFFVKRGDEVYVLNRGSREQVEGVCPIIADRGDLGGALRGMRFDAVLDIARTPMTTSIILLRRVSRDDVFVSSSAVYPETNPQPFSEKMPCGRNSVWGDYSVNKLEAERELIRQVPHSYILRPPYFYGVYENLYREAGPLTVR